jgi:hypothetical protein
VLDTCGALPAAVTAALHSHTATQSSRPSARLLPRLSWAVLVCDGVLYAWEQLASPPGSAQDDDLDAALRRSPLALKLDLPNEVQFDSASNDRYISSGNSIAFQRLLSLESTAVVCAQAFLQRSSNERLLYNCATQQTL